MRAGQLRPLRPARQIASALITDTDPTTLEPIKSLPSLELDAT